jgi:hypothetical protein
MRCAVVVALSRSWGGRGRFISQASRSSEAGKSGKAVKGKNRRGLYPYARLWAAWASSVRGCNCDHRANGRQASHYESENRDKACCTHDRTPVRLENRLDCRVCSRISDCRPFVSPAL